MRAGSWILGASALACAVAVAMTFAAPAPSLPAPAIPEEKKDGYVSSDACRACHPREYATWRASYHRGMTQRVHAETALGDFDDVSLELDGVDYRLFRRGDEVWASWGGVERQLVLSTGSHHDQMYWYASDSGEGLEQFPFDYSRRLGRWIPVRSSFLFPPDDPQPDFPGRWSAVCSRCHSVNAPRRQGEPREVSELGIACEACHGPAEEHVAAHRSPLDRYASRWDDAPDPTIANPRQLDAKRSAATCGQCHGTWFAEAAPFRPGEEIRDKWVFMQLRYLDPDFRPANAREREVQHTHRLFAEQRPDFQRGTFWADGVVRVSGREYTGLLESPCFERGEMSCTSCHTLHQSSDDPRTLEEWANDQVTVGMEGNGACLQCHPTFSGDALARHTHHDGESAGSLCTNCHMPYSVYGIQKAHRSHTITSPSVAESVEVGRPNACNQCHLDRDLGWTAAALAEWYGIRSPALTEEQSSVAAGVRWTLRGDAGMRALMGWSMGWGSAREASGALGDRDWMIPYLATLLDDPYDSVRFVALQALRARDAYASFDYDFVGPPAVRREAARLVAEHAGSRYRAPAEDRRGALLLDEAGRLEQERFARLASERDDTPVSLFE